MKKFLSYKKMMVIGSFMLLCDVLAHERAADVKEYDGIVAIVNDSLITSLDLKKRVELARFAMGGKSIDDKIRRNILSDMISEKLKWWITQKFAPSGGWVPESAVNDAFANIAAQNNMKTESFKQLMRKHGVDPNTLIEQLRVNLSWLEYVKARYSRSVGNISAGEMSNLIKDVKDRQNKEAYFVSRMFFPVVNEKSDKEVRARVDNVMSMLRSGANFSNVARQFSSENAIGKRACGEIGWVFKEQLNQAEGDAVSQMKVGELKVVKNNNGYYIILLKDKKQGGNSYTSVKFSQVIIPLEASQGTDVSNLISFVNKMKDSCSSNAEFIQQSKDAGFFIITDPVEVVLESMHPEMRNMLSPLVAGKMSKPIVTENSIVVICMLDRRTHKIKEPTADELRFQKIAERLSVYAEKELQDAHKKADLKAFGQYASMVK